MKFFSFSCRNFHSSNVFFSGKAWRNRCFLRTGSFFSSNGFEWEWFRVAFLVESHDQFWCNFYAEKSRQTIEIVELWSDDSLLFSWIEFFVCRMRKETRIDRVLMKTWKLLAFVFQSDGSVVVFDTSEPNRYKPNSSETLPCAPTFSTGKK